MVITVPLIRCSPLCYYLCRFMCYHAAMGSFPFWQRYQSYPQLLCWQEQSGSWILPWSHFNFRKGKTLVTVDHTQGWWIGGIHFRTKSKQAGTLHMLWDQTWQTKSTDSRVHSHQLSWEVFPTLECRTFYFGPFQRVRRISSKLMWHLLFPTDKSRSQPFRWVLGSWSGLRI